MYENTHVYEARPARDSRRWWIASGAVLAAALLFLIVYTVAGGPGPDTVPTAGNGSPAADTSASAGTGDDAAQGAGDTTGDTTGDGDQGDAAGGSGTGSGSDGDAGDPADDGRGEPPYIRDLYPEAFFEGAEDGEGMVLTAIMSGHAFDPDGPDDQERVARLDIDWGDGTVSTASLGGHGAFDAHHIYDPGFAGQSVTVEVIAHGHDGQSATQSVTLDLPTP